MSVIDGVCPADAEHGHGAGMQRAIDSPSPTKQRNAPGPARHGTVRWMLLGALGASVATYLTVADTHGWAASPWSSLQAHIRSVAGLATGDT